MGFKQYKVPGVKRPLRLSPEHAKALGAKEVKGSPGQGTSLAKPVDTDKPAK